MKIINKTPFNEWLKKTKLRHARQLATEDNSKSIRLELLRRVIGLPYDSVEKMTANDIVNRTRKFLRFLKRQGDKQCALRVIPRLFNLPKYRLKGKSFKKSIEWFSKLKINPNYYFVEVAPRNSNISASAIFTIGDGGIWGETIEDRLTWLSDGGGKKAPMIFLFDFRQWYFSEKNQRLKKLVKKAVHKLLISNIAKRKKLQKEISATFTKHGYLKGYFEFMVWPGEKIKFFDYNRLQANLSKNVSGRNDKKKKKNEWSGICASPGMAKGIARVVRDPKSVRFHTGDILICAATSFDYIPLMQKAGAIVTELGTVLSHAGVICRELKKPYVIRVRDAMKIKNGTKIKVDANSGSVYSV